MAHHIVIVLHDEEDAVRVAEDITDMLGLAGIVRDVHQPTDPAQLQWLREHFPAPDDWDESPAAGDIERRIVHALDDENSEDEARQVAQDLSVESGTVFAVIGMATDATRLRGGSEYLVVEFAGPNDMARALAENPDHLYVDGKHVAGEGAPA